MPILIVQGGSDFRVSPTRGFAASKAALAGEPDVTFRLFARLGHFFTPVGKTGAPADDAIAVRVDPAVIAAIAQWVPAQPPPEAAAAGWARSAARYNGAFPPDRTPPCSTT